MNELLFVKQLFQHVTQYKNVNSQPEKFKIWKSMELVLHCPYILYVKQTNITLVRPGGLS